jgi:hypothetical protein
MSCKRIKQLCCGLLAGIVLCACEQKQPSSVEQNFDLPQENLPNAIAFSQMQDSALNLPNELESQVLRYLKNYEGVKMKIQTPLPESWKVMYKLPPMSSDFDIWIVANAGDPTHKILATVTLSPFSIIQAVPVAYSAGIEENNFIESEQWTSVVKEDYTVVVTKLYEKLYSLTDTANRQASTSSATEDRYIIENNGKIRYEAPAIYDIDYRAVVQFADTASIGNLLGEDWLWNTIEIQEMIEPEEILFSEVTKNFNRVSIYSYRGDEVDVVDISPYLEKHNMGYLILEKKKKPIFIPYAPAKEILPKVFAHFSLEYHAKENEETELSSENE